MTFEVDANGILHVGATKCKEPGFDLEADESRHVVEVEETITIVRFDRKLIKKKNYTP